MQMCAQTRRSPLARSVMFHWEFGIFSVDFFRFVVSSEAVLAWTHTWRPPEDSVGAEMKELRNMSGRGCGENSGSVCYRERRGFQITDSTGKIQSQGEHMGSISQCSYVSRWYKERFFQHVVWVDSMECTFLAFELALSFPKLCSSYRLLLGWNHSFKTLPFSLNGMCVKSHALTFPTLIEHIRARHCVRYWRDYSE